MISEPQIKYQPIQFCFYSSQMINKAFSVADILVVLDIYQILQLRGYLLLARSNHSSPYSSSNTKISSFIKQKSISLLPLCTNTSPVSDILQIYLEESRQIAFLYCLADKICRFIVLRSFCQTPVGSTKILLNYQFSKAYRLDPSRNS